MWWYRKKQKIVVVESEKAVVPPKPKLEWAHKDYELIYHFKNREDYTYLYEGQYITEESHHALWKWEMKQDIYYLMFSGNRTALVGEYIVRIATNEAIQKVIANGIWIEDEFIAPHRITGCTRVELDGEEST